VRKIEAEEAGGVKPRAADARARGNVERGTLRVRGNLPHRLTTLQPSHHKTRLSVPARKLAVAHFAELKRGLGSACKILIRNYTGLVLSKV
jgi:hypothetical protein